MNWQTVTGSPLYRRLREINERVFGVLSVLLYSFLYLCIIPFFAVSAKKKIAARVLAGWQPWLLRSDSIEDLRKQY